MNDDKRSQPRPEDETPAPAPATSFGAPEGADTPEAADEKQSAPDTADAPEAAGAAEGVEAAGAVETAGGTGTVGGAGTAEDVEVLGGAATAEDAGRAAGAGTADRAGAGAVGGAGTEERAGATGGGAGDGEAGAAPGGELLPPVAGEDEAPPAARARLLGWSRSPAALLVGLLIGLLGFGLAVQVRSNTSTSGLPAARQEDLVRILDDLSSREDRLRRQIAELEAARSRLSTTGDRSSTALQEARKRSDALGILAGTVPAQGPGIELTLTDPERRLAAEDLLDTVEELRAAGAEAIQVGGVRIGLDSSFTATDRGIAVDGVAVAAPYTIVAIGDPPTLATAMEIPGGVADTAKRAGGDARADQRQQVVIRALRVVRAPRYSQPTN
jgi:uncharacterized protein YlxW (UPF0749 family)